MSLADTIKDLDDGIVDQLAELGVDVTWNRQTVLSFNAATGRSTSTPVSLALKCVVTDIPETLQPDGQQALQARFVFRLTDLGVNRIAIGDNIVLAGSTYQVFGVEVPQPGAVQIVDARLT